MGNWEDLPMDLLVLLYLYLPRRDRLACSLVCKKWKDGLDHVILWKTTVVHIDTDLMDPSTILLLRDYCKHVKNLEFGWEIPLRNNRWAPLKYKELTKRAVRLFLILYDNYIQITSFRIFNWFDFMSFQKVTYHLARFLKNQVNLKNIVFDNINMHSVNYMKILSACLTSRSTIASLDIRTCYYCQSSFDSVYFRSCIEQLSYLKSFKLDYFIFSCKIIDAILLSRNKCLENLEIILKETSWEDNIIDDSEWCLLRSGCPNLKVTMTIRNVYHYGDIRVYLKQSIPIVSLTLACPRILQQGAAKNFEKILNHVVKSYFRTLEKFDLNIRNENENIDNALVKIFWKCKNLRSFLFNGYLQYPSLFKPTHDDINYFCVLPGNPQKHMIFNKILKEDIESMTHKRVQFTYVKRKPNSVCSLLILN